MSTLTALDWPRLLLTPMTRWYLDRESWDTGQCVWQADCPDPVVAYVEYQVSILPGDADDWPCGWHSAVCAAHLPDLIEHATGEPLVADTVVEVGVDPALLRLTGVSRDGFNEAAMGVSA